MERKKPKTKKKLRSPTKLNKALKEEREKSGEHLNRLMYLQADFENYRKRMEKKIHETAQYCNEMLVTNLLSVIDELELALRSGKNTDNKQALLEGVEITLKKLYSLLGEQGLAQIEAIGNLFDPELHEVVMKVQTKDHEEGMIIEEIRKGYMFQKKVIRHSMVKIAANKGVDL